MQQVHPESIAFPDGRAGGMVSGAGGVGAAAHLAPQALAPRSEGCLASVFINLHSCLKRGLPWWCRRLSCG